MARFFPPSPFSLRLVLSSPFPRFEVEYERVRGEVGRAEGVFHEGGKRVLRVGGLEMIKYEGCDSGYFFEGELENNQRVGEVVNWIYLQIEKLKYQLIRKNINRAKIRRCFSHRWDSKSFKRVTRFCPPTLFSEYL